jgi:hypothetical protein
MWHIAFKGKCHTTLLKVIILQGPYVGAVVEAMHYKQEGRGIDYRWCHWNFTFT